MLLVRKFGGTSVGSAERVARAAELALQSAAAGHQVVVVTSAMSGVTNRLIQEAERAARGDWQPEVRGQIFEHHLAVADHLLREHSAYNAALETLTQRLDQFEKLCFGLSMVHELTPRLLDIISGIGEMLAAALVAACPPSRPRGT